tara:strand:+ start:369 stop:632 length:264 start_codon:yes stop_codon:yes gene_type:complete
MDGTPTEVMVDYVDAHNGRYGVKPICAVLPIAPSTYYEHKAREQDPKRLPERARRDAELKSDGSRVAKWNACDLRQLGVPRQPLRDS